HRGTGSGQRLLLLRLQDPVGLRSTTRAGESLPRFLLDKRTGAVSQRSRSVSGKSLRPPDRLRASDSRSASKSDAPLPRIGSSLARLGDEPIAPHESATGYLIPINACLSPKVSANEYRVA